MAKVLIPGGFGFIGSYLTQACVQRGDEVTVLSIDRRQPCIPLDLTRIRHITVDLRDRETTRQVLKNESPELVFNLSGYIDHAPYFHGGRDVLDQHFWAVQNLLEAIQRSDMRLFVQAGSSDEYGSAPSPQSEGMRENPISPYSMGKAAATQLIQSLSRTEGFPGVVARFFLVYGPGQDSKRFIPQIIQGCLSDKPFAVSEGKQLRDFAFVEDIVEGLLTLERNPTVCGQVINLASGIPVSIRAVIEHVQKLCARGQPTYGAVPYRTGENMSLVADISLARKTLGWSPKTSLEEGLKKTIEHYRHLAVA